MLIDYMVNNFSKGNQEAFDDSKLELFFHPRGKISNKLRDLLKEKNEEDGEKTTMFRNID